MVHQLGCFLDGWSSFDQLFFLGEVDFLFILSKIYLFISSLISSGSLFRFIYESRNETSFSFVLSVIIYFMNPWDSSFIWKKIASLCSLSAFKKVKFYLIERVFCFLFCFIQSNRGVYFNCQKGIIALFLAFIFNWKVIPRLKSLNLKQITLISTKFMDRYSIHVIYYNYYFLSLIFSQKINNNSKSLKKTNQVFGWTKIEKKRFIFVE